MTSTGPAVIAEGRLVRLREKHIDDAERDYAWRCDPELAAYDAARPLSVRFSNFLATMTEELQYPTIHRRTFAIEDLETGTHIGNVMYYGYDSVNREARLLRGPKAEEAISLRARLNRIPAESRTPEEQAKIEVLNQWYREAYLGSDLYPGLFRELQAAAAGMEGIDAEGARKPLEETAKEVLRAVGGVGR